MLEAAAEKRQGDRYCCMAYFCVSVYCELCYIAPHLAERSYTGEGATYESMLDAGHVAQLPVMERTFKLGSLMLATCRERGNSHGF